MGIEELSVANQQNHERLDIDRTYQHEHELAALGLPDEAQVTVRHQEALSPDDIKLLRGLGRTHFAGMRDQFGHALTHEGLRAQRIAREVKEREE